ncbi:MAG: flagellar basal body L-ring protein FlgH [Pseudomonadota bacterium]|nr:flagellar basal body L-ring protein FlgH [Pseudomonadota bacterium]
MSRLARFSPLALIACLAGCSAPKDFMRAPDLSAVGTGIAESSPDAAIELPAVANAVATPRALNLYTDQRITHVGDILTVNIAINDKAVVGNSSGRNTTSNGTLGFDWTFSPPTYSAGGAAGMLPSTSLNYKHDFNSLSNQQGAGNINRSEQIQLSVPAIVTSVLPNGNLVIKGSQEVRINYELRQLTIAGLVRPSDISRDNTVAYDRIAEARISYGGRGRLTEAQQPGWGQQAYDLAKPF